MAWLISAAMMNHYSNSHCSREQAEESLAGSCSDGEQFVPSRSMPMPQAYLFPGKTTAAWNRFPSGMTSQPLTERDGEGVLTSYLADFPVKTFRLREKGQDSTESDQDCGPSSREYFAKFDHDSRSWKTRQCSLLGGLIEFSGTWPKWGSMRNGESFRLPTPFGITALRSSITSAIESGLSQRLPTATVHGNHNRKGASKTSGNGLSTVVKRLPTPGAAKANNDLTLRCSGDGRTKPNKLGWAIAELETSPPLDGGALNPEWVEWFMGWPVGWTGLEPLATGKFRQWRQQHGEF